MGKKLGHRVAEIEAFQEAGVRGRTDKKPFGYYTYLKRLPDEMTIPCLVEVHLLRVNGLRSKFKEAGQRTLRWFDPAEASAMVEEPELQGLLRRLQDLG